MLLMFGVGLHFSLADLLAVKRIAVPGASCRWGGHAAGMGRGLASWGWSWGAGWSSACRCRCASTVVLLKALEARGVLEVDERPHRRRLAGRRGPGDGAGAGAAAAAGRRARRRGCGPRRQRRPLWITIG
jgi:hypothetical protein